jgi:hypothetical protein
MPASASSPPGKFEKNDSLFVIRDWLLGQKKSSRNAL